jgi:hypothetical protein
MRLTIEQSYTLLKKHGCYVNEACDKCGHILGPVRFTQRSDNGAWCSAIVVMERKPMRQVHA